MKVPYPAAAHRGPVIVTENLQGHYAGFVSRFAGFAADAGVSNCLFLAGLAATTFAVGLITGHSVTWTKSSPVVLAVYVVWLFIYYAYSWGAFGRTVGMALLGVRVVRADGDGLSPRRAVIRTLVFPFSFILGLGFVPVLLRQDRRALHDLAAGTAVVYSWDARAARLRFLAHKSGHNGERPLRHPRRVARADGAAATVVGSAQELGGPPPAGGGPPPPGADLRPAAREE